MTDREKIEAALGWAIPNSVARQDVFAEVERLIRDAAERAFAAGLMSPKPPGVMRLPPDFPLVLDAPKEPAK